MKVYFLKANPANYVIFPAPENGQDYYDIEVENREELDENELIVVNDKPLWVKKRPSPDHQWKNGKWTISRSDQAKLNAEQLTQKRAAMIGLIAEKTDQLKSQILVGYPQAEIDSFYRQEREARGWQLDKTFDTPMLTAIAENRGVSFEILVEKVIEKADLVAAKMGEIIGKRQAFEDQILQAENLEKLAEIEAEVEKWAV